MKVETAGRRALHLFLLGSFLLMWVGGVVSYLFLGGPPADAGWTAPAFLLLAALLTLATAPNRRQAALLGLGGILGFASEVVGVRTGIPFGGYRYTAALAPLVADVPLVLAAAWLVLAAYTRELLDAPGLRRWLRPLLGAVWMTAMDLVIDPLAAGPLGYWRWEGGGAYFGVPVTNFLGWLAVSLPVLALLEGGWRPHPWARRIGAGVLLFFTALAGGLGYAGPALLGLGLLAVDLFWRSRSAASRAS